MIILFASYTFYKMMLQLYSLVGRYTQLLTMEVDIGTRDLFRNTKPGKTIIGCNKL